MAHTLSDVTIARLVGAAAFARGQRYAEDGHVGELTWSGSGNALFGNVEGTRARPYVVQVTFRTDAASGAVSASGVCTCPVTINCKHVAALLIATRDHVTVVTPAATAPPPPGWQRALAPLARQREAAPPTGTALAIQFDLLAPSHSGRYPDSAPLPRHLGARPMAMGKKGKWVRGNLTWDNLRYNRGSFNQDHLNSLVALYELYSAGQRYYYRTDQWIHLDSFPNRALWAQLEEARRTGLALITTNRLQDPISLSRAPADLTLDITRAESGLELTPTLTLADHVFDPRNVILLGEPAHGFVSWDHPGDESGPGGDPTEIRLTLAPFTNPIGPMIRDLVAAGSTISIPHTDESVFFSSYYPFLHDQLTLTSRDESFDLPDTPHPVLSLEITGKPEGDRSELHWEWRYVAPHGDPDATPLFRHSLWPLATDTSYRDIAAETEILRSLEGALGRFPSLTTHSVNGVRLAERSVLAGARMIEFMDPVVPELTASGTVVVNVIGNMPEYREADEAPLITLATTERADDRDWFDLAVDVSVDGHEIPFNSLFLALATEQEVMILPNGVWFSLDRSELQQLRRLIEEARGLQDSASKSLGISRFQTDLWEELQTLGVVAEQAAAWRDAVAGLAENAQITAIPLPDAVHATLRGYQQEGFDWLSFLYDQQLGGVLADDMGLGKTLQAIALIAHTRQQNSVTAPFLVVAPTSVVGNWAAECARFAPSLRVVTITETSGRRAAGILELAAVADVVITSYTLFRLDFDEYNGQEWAGLLLDEAQFVRNHQSRAHQCARRLSTPFKLAITGTPLENNLMELWSLFSITAPGMFPSPRRFAEYYQKAIEKDGDAHRLSQLRRRIRPFMLRRTKEQVASDLPRKQEQVLELELHPKHRKVYQTHLQRERQKVLGLIDDMNANRFEIFRSLTMLRQLSLDASLYDEKYANVPSTKLDALLELLEDVVAEGHRTLIFSQFTGYLAKARSRLDAAGISYSYLDGKTRSRAKVIDGFKNGTDSVFLISLKAGGFGLNLTEADYCILLDPWWNPATEAQAVDRVHRIGQTKNVMVYRLVAKDTIEEKVMALKAVKAKLFDSVMTDGAAIGAKFTAADIRELLE